MKDKDIKNAKNPLLSLALPALQRAAVNARKQAIIYNTKLIFWQNNHLVKLSPNEVREKTSDY
ncbi:MAG: hypothetical protein ACC653_10390 [Gammaproteobacteria bacterium]